ncbi:MAG: DUF1194 domain-containing protein [Betaproteobacteria bacterium]
MFKKLIASIGFALVMGLGAAAPANATLVGLSLLIDGSGSISAADFTTQKNGYINALSAILATDGSVAIEVYQFANNTVSSVFSLQVIGAGQKASLLAALGAMAQLGGGTPTGPAIVQAAADLNAFAGLTRKIIDVSTDGFGNQGINETTAALNAVAGGINQVNVLCIGGSANCNFNAGTGSFNVAATFANFQSTLEGKLRRELQIPEPGPLALLALGLLTMVVVRRRA